MEIRSNFFTAPARHARNLVPRHGTARHGTDFSSPCRGTARHGTARKYKKIKVFRFFSLKFIGIMTMPNENNFKKSNETNKFVETDFAFGAWDQRDPAR